LTPLQIRVLRLLAANAPRWTLTGGGALALAHGSPRPTRDLDLFWHDLRVFDREPTEVVACLQAAGLEVGVVQRAPGFVRIQAGDVGADHVIIDLVADPGEVIAPPEAIVVDGIAIPVDARHEILVNKLCALLGRAEPRDLVDVRRLVESGCDLAQALRDAPRKDSGFSLLVLAWVLQSTPLKKNAISAGMSPEEADGLDAFRASLCADLVAMGTP
jgi:hypothetical protein